MNVSCSPTYISIEVLHKGVWIGVLRMNADTFSDSYGCRNEQVLEVALEENHRSHGTLGDYGYENCKWINHAHPCPLPYLIGYTGPSPDEVLFVGETAWMGKTSDPVFKKLQRVRLEDLAFQCADHGTSLYLSREQWSNLVDQLPAVRQDPDTLHPVHYHSLINCNSPMLSWCEMAMTALPIPNCIDITSELYMSPEAWVMKCQQHVTNALQQRQTDLATAYAKQMQLEKLFSSLLPCELVRVIVEYASPRADDVRIVIADRDITFKEKHKSRIWTPKTMFAWPSLSRLLLLRESKKEAHVVR